MIEFRPDTDNRTTRLRVVVPQAVQDALEATYRDGTVGQLPYEDPEDADALVSLFRTHANRRGLKLHVDRGTDDDGRNVLTFKMRPKRTYTKRNTAFWQHA